jgi:DNA invertase Pin-like site-specific DNA recombinase
VSSLALFGLTSEHPADCILRVLESLLLGVPLRAPLAINTLHILETVKALTDRGVTLVSVTDGIDSSTAAGRMMIGVLGSLAEYERELIKERTALKRQASRANGTKFGRPRRVEDPVHISTAKRMKSAGHTSKDIAKYLGVSRATLYRYLVEEPGI